MEQHHDANILDECGLGGEHHISVSHIGSQPYSVEHLHDLVIHAWGEECVLRHFAEQHDGCLQHDVAQHGGDQQHDRDIHEWCGESVVDHVVE